MKKVLSLLLIFAMAFGLVGCGGDGRQADEQDQKNEKEVSAYNRMNPAPIGIEQTINIQNSDNSYDVAIKLSEVLRGEKLNEIMGSTVANDEPTEGCEFIAAKFSIAVSNMRDKEQSISFSSSSFESYTSNNEKLDSKYIYLQDDAYLDAKLYDGGKAEGYVIFQVQQADQTPKAVFNVNYDGTGGAWFKLN